MTQLKLDVGAEDESLLCVLISLRAIRYTVARYFHQGKALHVNKHVTLRMAGDIAVSFGDPCVNQRMFVGCTSGDMAVFGPETHTGQKLDTSLLECVVSDFLATLPWRVFSEEVSRSVA